MTIISLEALSRFFAIPKTEALPLPVASVDPRMTAYMQARARHVATWGEGNMDTWEEAQFSGPTGVMREDWVTLYEE